MSITPHAGIIDFGIFTPPDGAVDGIQGEVPPPLASQAGYILSTTGWIPNSGGGGGSGTVTSVDMTVPTGLVVTGNPITTAGTLALSYLTGYSIPTTASQANWDTAYTQRLQWDGGSTGLVAATGRTSLGATTIGSNLFTLTNPSAVTFPRFNADNTVSALDAATFRTAIGAGTGSGTVTSVTGTAPISSSGGTTPAISISQATTSTNGYLSSTDWNTFNNKQPAGSYLTTVTADTPLSGSGTSGSHLVIAQANTTTSGYLSSTDWNTFNNKQPAGSYLTTVTASAPLSGSGTAGSPLVISQATTSTNGYLSSTDWNTFNNKQPAGSYLTAVTADAPLSGSGTSGSHLVISQATTSTNGYLSSTDWNTFNGKAPATSGTSILYGNGSGGFSNVTIGSNLTFVAGVLSATGGGGGGGTVTSVDMTVPTGLSISGNPITTSGTLALTYTTGYSIPTTASQANWDSAYTQRLQWDGGSTNLVAATGRTSLGATTLGGNLFTITNPSAVTFPRFNADNTVSALDAATFRTAIGAGTGSGTVTSVAATAGTGISVTGSPITSSGTLTITNTAPDQTVVMTSGTGISVTGTYPNFTVTNTAPSSGGTVTSVTGTAPIASTGGTTPAISISQASSITNGYLSSTDWNTFNNKQPAGSYLTAVTADAPLSGSGTSGSHLVISQATTSTNGYLSSTDWNTFNNKAPAFTYTTNYIPYGNGTTTPQQSSQFQYNGAYLLVGGASPLGGLTNPVSAFTGNPGTTGYIQAYVFNANSGVSSSADLVAYADNSTDSHGWADVGFTSSTYADSVYTITGPNEAYLFGSALNSSFTGNLVYATDSTGSENSHQFYVGGFTQAKGAWKMQLSSSSLQVAVPVQNTRITPRVLASTANSATPTLNTDSYDMMVITGQSVAITSFTTNLTGTPTNGQKLWIAITGTTAIAITWGASFESSTATLPTTTVSTARLDIGFVWNVATSKWRCVAVA